jgi:hypothetical protein
VRLLLILFSTLCFSSSLELQKDLERSGNFITAKSFKKDIERGKLIEKANHAIDQILERSILELRKHNALLLAERISHEYQTTYRGFIGSFGVGDHAGIEWLLKIHSEIEFVLGETLCRAIRTHDLFILAHTIPIAINCSPKVDEIEYMLHFIPFLGVVSYWGTYATCVGATLGSGGVFFCGFIGMGVEQIVTRFIAPPLSQSAFKKACK